MRPILFLLILTSCAVGPDYIPPHCSIPNAWHNQGKAIPVEIDWTWWQNFDDAQLTWLVCEAVNYNPEVFQAWAKIAEARGVQKIASSYFWPQIDFTGNAIKQRISAKGPIISEIPPTPTPVKIPLRLDVFTLDLDARWEIDIWGGI